MVLYQWHLSHLPSEYLFQNLVYGKLQERPCLFRLKKEVNTKWFKTMEIEWNDLYKGVESFYFSLI